MKYRSKNTGIATVSSAGKVTAVGTGETEIIVSTDNNTDVASIPVSVVPDDGSVRPTRIALNTQKETIFSYASSEKLRATVYPENATNKTVYWETSDPSLIKIVPKGNTCEIMSNESSAWGITTENKTATVTARTVNGLSATCTVTLRVQGTIVDSIEIAPNTVNIKNGKVVVDYKGSNNKEITLPEGEIKMPNGETVTLPEKKIVCSFMVKCNYHNTSTVFAGVDFEQPTQQDMNNLVVDSPRQGSKPGEFYIPVVVAFNPYGERELTLKIRGEGAGDSWKTVTVVQEANTTMNVDRYPDKTYYNPAGGKAVLEDPSENRYSIDPIIYYANASVDKTIINNIKVSVGSVTESAAIGKPNDSITGWVYITGPKLYLNGHTASDAEWQQAKKNAGPNTVFEWTCSIQCAENTTGEERTAVVTLPEGEQISVKQGA